MRFLSRRTTTKDHHAQNAKTIRNDFDIGMLSSLSLAQEATQQIKEQTLGLQRDYKTLGKKQDRDGFENWLTTLLLDSYGKDVSSFLTVAFHEIGEQDVCRVIVRASSRPVFVEQGEAEHLFIRTGNSTRLLSTKEALEYCKKRWV